MEGSIARYRTTAKVEAALGHMRAPEKMMPEGEWREGWQGARPLEIEFNSPAVDGHNGAIMSRGTEVIQEAGT